MKLSIKNRWNGAVLFEAEIECAADASDGIRLGLAVRVALEAGTDLARANLADADLTGADLARANLADANLAGANLADANLAGANLAGANLAGANLARAYLTGTDLARANLADANLAGADLAGANLAGANLARAYLTGADLTGTDLARAYLTGADLTGTDLARAYLTVVNDKEYDIPVVENIDAKILAAIEAGGSLDMGSWHRCETTHCRAGWAIHLAGERGYALEKAVGARMAGAMIYRASRPGVPAPWFFDTDERALADIKKCAAESTS